jgi:hypothetical protein
VPWQLVGDSVGFVTITTSELVGRLTRWKLINKVAIKKEWPGGWIGGEEHISYLLYTFCT